MRCYRDVVTEEQRIAGFTEAIWEWYATHKRSLPWRDMPIDDPTERAYRVLVSEIMLQQTQVSRVIIVFKNFIDRFGSIGNLASASNAEVIMAWRGMGYNSRALRLRDAAKSVVDIFGGVFPSDYDELLAIKGLGPYTASAIRNFAFNIPTPCIDTNIRRIFHRTFVGPENVDGTWPVSDKKLLNIAEMVLNVAIQKPEIRSSKSEKNTQYTIHNTGFLHDARNWHAALMDYGSLVQTKNNPKWDICVLTQSDIMVTKPADWSPPVRGAAKEKLKKEPGRMVGSTYIPNRIFRGRIVEALRDADAPLDAETIGRQVCIDWAEEHREWLQGLVDKLVKDALIARTEQGYVLS